MAEIKVRTFKTPRTCVGNPTVGKRFHMNNICVTKLPSRIITWRFFYEQKLV
jgi:hypothetical protein